MLRIFFKEEISRRTNLCVRLTVLFFISGKVVRLNGSLYGLKLKQALISCHGHEMFRMKIRGFEQCLAHANAFR